jgi:hypothetical protein
MRRLLAVLPLVLAACGPGHPGSTQSHVMCHGAGCPIPSPGPYTSTACQNMGTVTGCTTYSGGGSQAKP